MARRSFSARQTPAQAADGDDLRAVIAEALATQPVDLGALRRGVWNYVGAERAAATSPGHVIMALTDLIDAAKITPLDEYQSLVRRVILWCVEAYFGHLGGDVMGRDGMALSDSNGEGPR